jgi:hypothetical protein
MSVCRPCAAVRLVVSDNLAIAFEFVNQTAGDAVAPDFPPASYDAAALPLMHIDGPQPILDILDAAGFVDVAVESRPDLSVGSGTPYLLTATRR